MFDVLQNVFWKKKDDSKAESEKAPDNEEFEILETAVEAQERNLANDDPPPYPPMNPCSPPGSMFPAEASSQSEERKSMQTPFTIQDVPFVLNSAFSASTVLDQIWRSVAPCLASISKPSSLQMEYDFSLENSVISETLQ